jgi:hypothetical protein
MFADASAVYCIQIPLCNAATGHNASAAILEYLEGAKQSEEELARHLAIAGAPEQVTTAPSRRGSVQA